MEIESHHSNKAEKLDLQELEGVSGEFHDWQKEGWAATCEWDSWCVGNDTCIFFDVTYYNSGPPAPTAMNMNTRANRSTSAAAGAMPLTIFSLDSCP